MTVENLSERTKNILKNCGGDRDCFRCPYKDYTNCETALIDDIAGELLKSEHIEPQEAAIDHPAHYQGEFECIDLMREIYGDEAVRHFCICNAYKYRFRAGAKQGETAQSDIAKAEWYEAYVMEHMMQNNKLEWERRMADEMKRNAYCEMEE